MSNTWYHASPIPDLEELGLDPDATPHVSRRTQRWVYFGTMKYLEDQYFKYAPKQTYYIYEVDVQGLYTEELMEDQIRTPQFVDAERIKFTRVCKTGE